MTGETGWVIVALLAATFFGCGSSDDSSGSGGHGTGGASGAAGSASGGAAGAAGASSGGSAGAPPACTLLTCGGSTECAGQPCMSTAGGPSYCYTQTANAKDCEPGGTGVTATVAGAQVILCVPTGCPEPTTHIP
jgi:hypothetical protein